MIQDWFLEAKLGIFIHWGIYSVKPTGESWPFFNGEISYEDYMAQAKSFKAERYDPRAWADLFRKAGANYAVLTAKHHDGVALWDTEVGGLSVVKSTPAGRDLIGPYCDALREAGLHVGLYFSHLDWSHPDYPTLKKRIPEGDSGGAAKVNRFNYQGWDDPKAWGRFLAFHRGQMRELCHRYKPELLWFDGDWDHSAEEWRMEEFAQQIQEWSPGAVINGRMQEFGDYKTPEQGLPIERPKGPWEFCMTMNDHWGYMDSDRNYKSLRQIIRIFVDCLSMGGNLLLDIGPRSDGTIPEEQVEVLEGLGRWNAKHAEAIYPTGPGLPAGHFYGPTTLSKDKSSLYLFMFDKPIDEIPLKGIKNKVKSVSVVGTSDSLRWKSIGGAAWNDIPGTLWIEVPESVIDRDGTVIRLELDGPLDLYRGAGREIAQN